MKLALVIIMVVILDCDCYILTSNDHVTIQCITDSDCPLHLACGDDGGCVHPPSIEAEDACNILPNKKPPTHMGYLVITNQISES